MIFNCKICGFSTEDPNAFAQHIKKDHQMAMQTYYDNYLRKEGEGICPICGKPTQYQTLTKGYREFCSIKCANAQKQVQKTEKQAKLECKICQKIFEGTAQQVGLQFTKHLKEHNIYEPKIYYDKYVREQGEGICPVCGKETTFYSILRGYDKYCSTKCSGMALKNTENTQQSKLHKLVEVKESIKNLGASIIAKYKNFIANDKKPKWSDLRTDPITHNTIATEATYIDENNKQYMVKTEISCSTERRNNIGNQSRYAPKFESCNQEYKFDEIIEDNVSLDESEWCN